MNNIKMFRERERINFNIWFKSRIIHSRILKLKNSSLYLCFMYTVEIFNKNCELFLSFSALRLSSFAFHIDFLLTTYTLYSLSGKHSKQHNFNLHTSWAQRGLWLWIKMYLTSPDIELRATITFFILKMIVYEVWIIKIKSSNTTFRHFSSINHR